MTESNEDKFPYVIGEKAEIYHNGVWKRGIVVSGYRFKDGIVTIRTASGETLWCGADRVDLYRKVENE